MNLCLFFEGTGRGVAGKVTNVTRLRDICVDDVGIEVPKLVDTIALMQLAFSFATFAFFAAKTSESSRVV